MAPSRAGQIAFELSGNLSALAQVLPGAGKKRDTCSRPGIQGWNHP